MRILLGSYRFSPDVGGIETASALLATEFTALGHDVRVVTETALPDHQEWPFEVLRRPAPHSLLKEARECDIFFQNNISLRGFWAAFVNRKPWVVTHQTWITRVNGTIAWRDRLKRLLLRFATNIAISEPMARDLGVECRRIGNPYQSEVFRIIPGHTRDRQLVFLGRLVSDKGLDILIRALAALRTSGMTPRLTVIGTGSEERSMRDLTVECGLQEQIEFVGQRIGVDLAELLNRHEILVVPSRWDEPFGIVALEGIACGCVVVGSEKGGLREAIGPCGLTFPNESIDGLAEVLRRLLSNPEVCQSLRFRREVHLAQFEARTIAREYLRVFESVAG
jgi:glycogen(starch) synthase